MVIERPTRSERLALFERADNAVTESRHLVADLQRERARAASQIRFIASVAAEFTRPVRVLYPSDTHDTR